MRPGTKALLLRLPLPLLVLGFLVWISWDGICYYFLSDNEKIDIVVRDVIEGARERDIGRILKHVADTYQDPFHPNKDSLRRNMQGMWMQFKSVSVRLEGKPEIVIDPDNPDQATADFTAEVLLGAQANEEPTDNLVGRTRGSPRFRLFLKKEGSDWLIVNSGIPPTKN